MYSEKDGEKVLYKKFEYCYASIRHFYEQTKLQLLNVFWRGAKLSSANCQENVIFGWGKQINGLLHHFRGCAK